MTSALRDQFRRFFDWYERHYTLNVAIVACLFVLQLVHLYWLSAEVVSQRLTGAGHFHLTGVAKFLILIVDYTEIPALLGTSLLYINELRKGFTWKALIFLVFLNTQWIHLFWITDTFVVNEFSGNGSATQSGGGSGIPGWLAWVAILIDYLELPVIFDTLRKFFTSLRQQRVRQFLREELAGD
jgi:hypothetical protein